MAPLAAIVMVGFSSSVSESDGSMERLGLPERAKHEMGDVGARNEEAAPQILPVRRAVGAGHGLVGQPWRESTASAPPTADSRAAGSGAARSALTARTPGDSFWGFRTTAVTS